jgi:uroporphyrinogen-III synthase
MVHALRGRTIALAEGRQLEDLAALLEAEGATTLRCPMLGIVDTPDEAAVRTWLEELLAGRFDLLVLMTGESVRRLIQAAERLGQHAEVVAALGRTRTLTRGPKPGQALRELGLVPSRVAPTPTTKGVLTALREEAVAGRTIGITLAGAPNPALEQGLLALGAQVLPVLPYVYAPGTDDDRILELIELLRKGTVDALVFTSGPQVERLFAVAQQHHREEELRQGLVRARIAAVGPVVAEALRHHGAPVHICPEQGFVMKNLVQHIKRAFGD